MIAERELFGTSLEATLQGQGYHVTLEDAHDSENTACREFDLVIATNTSLSCNRLGAIIPDIKARCPNARIIVLSGYCAAAWVADLKQRGINEFLELPYDEGRLLKEVACLLSAPVPFGRLN